MVFLNMCDLIFYRCATVCIVTNVIYLDWSIIVLWDGLGFHIWGQLVVQKLRRKFLQAIHTEMKPPQTPHYIALHYR